MKLKVKEPHFAILGRLLTAGLLCAACWVFGCARSGSSDPADADLAADRAVEEATGPEEVKHVVDATREVVAERDQGTELREIADEPCVPQCEGWECGPDGCGGLCGSPCCWGCRCSGEGKCVTVCGPPGYVYGGGWDGTFGMTFVEFGTAGRPGEGLDIDMQPDTCAPVPTCSDGVDNQFSSILSELEGHSAGLDILLAPFRTGEFSLLMEPYGWNSDGTEFILKLYLAMREDDSCIYSTEPCEYLGLAESFDEVSCEVVMVMEGATFDGKTLRAGGPRNYGSWPWTEFGILIPTTLGILMGVYVSHVQLVADVEVDETGVVSLSGILGGVLHKEYLLQGVDRLLDVLTDSSLAVIREILADELVGDIDIDKDGTMGGVSFGLKFHSVPARIVDFLDDWYFPR